MTLTLRIENETSLPDGGPLSVTITGKRGIDIGRDPYLDWTLPDPTRFISAKHCEVRWHDDGYWLHDISTNGTFLEGAASRLKQPHRLRDGDRFAIGRFIVAVSLDDEDLRAAAPEAQPAPSYEQLWDAVGDAAPPIDPKMLKAARDLAPVKPDFLDWAVDVPGVFAPGTPTAAARPAASETWDAPRDAPRPAASIDSWAESTPKPPPPPPKVSPLPTPRRPLWVSNEPDGPWAGPAAAAAERRPREPDAAGAAQPSFDDAPPIEPAAPPPRPAARAEPPPRRDPAPVRTQASAGETGDINDFIRILARSAGLADDALASRDPTELAQELGELLQLVAANMKQLMEARQHAKRLARSYNQTTIQALDNNPLKFAPSAQEALRIMMGPRTRSYLDARRALAEGFDDIKAHQLTTYTAMQQAAKLTLRAFDPATIEAESQNDRGLMGALGSRKARLWDHYVAGWQARTARHDDGALAAFMEYFAECYDRDGNDA